MAKGRKYSEVRAVKPGRHPDPNKSESGSIVPTSTSKTYEIIVSKGSIKKDTAMKEIVIVGMRKGSQHRSTIISKNPNKPEWKMTAVEKMEMVREGVSKKSLEALKSKTNLDYDKLSTILTTTRATLINKKGSEHFSPALSERIVSIADLYSYGFEVFEDETRFNKWIFNPNQALGGKQPFELLDNQFGREEVKNVIGRIEYGVYS